MITDNLRQILYNYFLGGYLTRNRTPTITLTDINGVKQYLAYDDSNYDTTGKYASYRLANFIINISGASGDPSSDTGSNSYGNIFMQLGSAEHPIETINDLDLENKITSGLKYVTSGMGYSNKGVIYTTTFGNESDSILPVTEIGLYLRISEKTSSPLASTMVKGIFLLNREILDTPVTLAPGQSAVFSIELNYY